MLDRHSPDPAPIHSHHVGVAAVALSLAVHVLVVSGIARLYEPVTILPADPAGTEPFEPITFIDLTSTAAGPAAAAGVPQSIPPAPTAALESRTVGAEPDTFSFGTEPTQALRAGPPEVTSEWTSPSPLFPRRPPDPRLYVGTDDRALSPPPSALDAISGRMGGAVAAVPDSLAAQARREATMGLTRKFGQLRRGEKLIMPTDGGLWETTQMMIYSEIAVRDSIRQERTRVMRERADAARGSGGSRSEPSEIESAPGSNP